MPALFWHYIKYFIYLHRPFFSHVTGKFFFWLHIKKGLMQEYNLFSWTWYFSYLVNCYPPFKRLHNLTDINNYKHKNFSIENKVIIFLGILCWKLTTILELSFFVSVTVESPIKAIDVYGSLIFAKVELFKKVKKSIRVIP